MTDLKRRGAFLMGVRRTLINWSWEVAPIRKLVSLHATHKRYGFSYPDLWALWSKAKREFTPGRKEFITKKEKTVTNDFFQLVAARSYREAEEYICVNGCCIILWRNGSETASYGPAGCTCQNLQDPRDLRKGALKK